MSQINDSQSTSINEEEPLYRFPSSSSVNDRPLFGDTLRNRDRLLNIGLLAACGLLIIGTIITLIFVKFSPLNLMALLCIASYAGSDFTLLYWYRLGDLDPKFRKLLIWNSINLIFLCIIALIHYRNQT